MENLEVPAPYKPGRVDRFVDWLYVSCQSNFPPSFRGGDFYLAVADR